MHGAGGTDGGIGQFLLGFAMMYGGFYVLFNAIIVQSSFGLGMSMYGFSALGGRLNITSGMVMIPFLFGIRIVFYNAKKDVGWLLARGALVALIFGILSSSQFSMRAMSAFELITIMVLAFGGLGLFLRAIQAPLRLCVSTQAALRAAIR